jgi:hypothetical protein
MTVHSYRKVTTNADLQSSCFGESFWQGKEFAKRICVGKVTATFVFLVFRMCFYCNSVSLLAQANRGLNRFFFRSALIGFLIRKIRG